MKKTLSALFFAGLIAATAHATTLISIDPANGAVSGAPGETVGWGFTITNDTDFLVVTGSSFTPASPLGTYDDFIGTGPLIVVGPSPESSVVSQAFDAIARTGVGAFTFNNNAPTGPINGTLTIDYSLFSRSPNDPNFNPDTDTVIPDAQFTQLVQADVTPEPGSWLLLTGGMLLLGRRWTASKTRRL